MTVFLDRLFALQGSCIPACSPPRPAHPVPVPVPKLGSKSPPPQQNPSCSTQESRPVSDEEYSYLGPQLCYRTPSLLCPLPLHPHPAGCVVLCCTASKFLVP